MTDETTPVVIIGAGVAGLALATFLACQGVACTVLERRERAYVEQRQRAGVVDARNVDMFARRGLAEALLGGPVAQTIDYRLDGESRVFGVTAHGGAASRFCTQQMLVAALLRELVDTRGGDVRFGVREVAITNPGGGAAQVGFVDDAGAHTLRCAHVVGCDGARGVSRASVPPGVLRKHSREYGYGWLAVLAQSPPAEHAIMAASAHGFAAQLPRGPARSRFYLQCEVSDGVEDWPDARVWSELRLRLGLPDLPAAPILDRDVIALRSVVFSPMQHLDLYLAGDAAHLTPPTGAKGMNLALSDVDVLADALGAAVLRGEVSGLAGYSDAVMPRIWRYQEFSAWMTETLHEAGRPAPDGDAAPALARARLDALFASPAAARLHADYLSGTA